MYLEILCSYTKKKTKSNYRFVYDLIKKKKTNSLNSGYFSWPLIVPRIHIY